MGSYQQICTHVNSPCRKEVQSVFSGKFLSGLPFLWGGEEKAITFSTNWQLTPWELPQAIHSSFTFSVSIPLFSLLPLFLFRLVWEWWLKWQCLLPQCTQEGTCSPTCLCLSSECEVLCTPPRPSFGFHHQLGDKMKVTFPWVLPPQHQVIGHIHLHTETIVLRDTPSMFKIQPCLLTCVVLRQVAQ